MGEEKRKCYDGCCQLSNGYCYAHSRGGNIVLEGDTPMCGFTDLELDFLFKTRINYMAGDLTPLTTKKDQ